MLKLTIPEYLLCAQTARDKLGSSRGSLKNLQPSSKKLKYSLQAWILQLNRLRNKRQVTINQKRRLWNILRIRNYWADIFQAPQWNKLVSICLAACWQLTLMRRESIRSLFCREKSAEHEKRKGKRYASILQRLKIYLNHKELFNYIISHIHWG